MRLEFLLIGVDKWGRHEGATGSILEVETTGSIHKKTVGRGEPVEGLSINS